MERAIELEDCLERWHGVKTDDYELGKKLLKEWLSECGKYDIGSCLFYHDDSIVEVIGRSQAFHPDNYKDWLENKELKLNSIDDEYDKFIDEYKRENPEWQSLTTIQ